MRNFKYLLIGILGTLFIFETITPPKAKKRVNHVLYISTNFETGWKYKVHEGDSIEGVARKFLQKV